MLASKTSDATVPSDPKRLSPSSTICRRANLELVRRTSAAPARRSVSVGSAVDSSTPSTIDSSPAQMIQQPMVCIDDEQAW